MSESLSDLDRIDLKILNVLQQDGRISNLKLAEAVALSPTAVLARVQRLTRDGFILGYEARLNPDKLGAGLLVGTDPARIQAAFERLWDDPGLHRDMATRRNPFGDGRSAERIGDILHARLAVTALA